MKYATGGAFRQALEERIRQQSLGSTQTLTRLRKMVAFERFLARLVAQDSDAWVIKGGFAIQLRLGRQTRTTKDIDVAVPAHWTEIQAIQQLHQAMAVDLKDWFRFEVGESSEVATGAPFGGLRFLVRCLLDGRQFETFHLDVGMGDPIHDKPEGLTIPSLLDFAEIPPAKVLCYPFTTQVAEKLHAYTRMYRAGDSSRARDVVDVLLIASVANFSSLKLRAAIQATFDSRGTHPMPKRVPAPPRGMAGPYRKLAKQVRLPWATLREAGKALTVFLNPVLRQLAEQVWDPSRWDWTPG